MKIAVCITTTPNRTDLFGKTFLKVVENSQEYVSYKIYNDVNYEGIAKAKNKCLAQCDGYDYVFLLDDDIYPTDVNWVQKYIDSGLNHAMYIFGRTFKEEGQNYRSFDLPRGCMLFFTRHCIDTAGGFDEDFIKWGYEHAELSRRIFNRGLTPAPYIDILDSHGLFYAFDQYQDNISSVSQRDRAEGIKNNKPLFDATVNSNTFKPYK